MRLEVKVQKFYYLTESDKELIKKWLKEKGITLGTVAKDLNVCYKHLIDILSARRSIRKEFIEYFRNNGCDLKRNGYEIVKE